MGDGMDNNFLDDIVDAVEDGDEIEGIVIGRMGWDSDYNSDTVPMYDKIPFGKLLKFKEAKKYLDFHYSTGYGSPECPAVYVWTRKKVIFVVQYDGSTCLYSVPRYPCDCMPIMPGGG